MDLDVNKIIERLGRDISGYVIKIAVLECQLEMLQEKITKESSDRENKVKE